MRLIDADALVAKMNLAIAVLKRTIKNFDIEDDPECQMELKAYQDIRDGIKEEPTIEPERKTGKWIKVHGYCTPGGDPVWACSECGKGIHVYGIEHGTYGADIADDQWKACPNCGAEMEEEQYGKN